MYVKKFIIISTILVILEIVFLAICYVFFISQYFFADYIDELYQRFGLDMDSEENSGHNIIREYEQLFGYYLDWPDLLDILEILISFSFIFIAYIFLFSFMIIYLRHLKRKSSCKCKKAYSYISIIAAMIFSAPYFFFAYIARTEINLTKEEIYIFDDDFNQKTKRNINFMKARKIILYAGTSIVYILYIVHIILLCIYNKKLIIVEDNVNNVMKVNNVVNNDANNVTNINNVNNVNNNAYNPIQALSSNEKRISEK